MLPHKLKEYYVSKIYKLKSYDLNIQNIISRFHEDILLFFIKKLTFNHKVLKYFLKLRSKKLQLSAAKYINIHKPDVVFGVESNSYHLFKNINNSEVIKILFFGHIYEDISDKILNEEARIHPELAHTLITWTDMEIINQRRLEPELANFIIVPSTFAQKSLTSAGFQKEKIIVIPFGTDLHKKIEYRQKKKCKPFTILFVGGVGQRKGIKYLLEAAKKINDPENYRFLIIGWKMFDEEFLKEYEPWITRIQYCTDEDLLKYYQDAHMFILPSVVEGFGMVILDAMAAGLPVIATHNSGAPDVIRDGKDGIFIPIRDVEAIVQSIIKLSNDKSKLDEMSMNAYEQSSLFTWEKYEKRVMLHLQDLIND